MKIVEAIDIHCHFNHGARHDSSGREILSPCDLEFLQKERKRMNVVKTGMCSFASVLSTENIVEENAYLAELAKTQSWLLQWVVIDPRQRQTFSQARELLKNKNVLGIKIHSHSVCHNYPFQEYADEIFAFANELKTVVLMHPEEDPDAMLKTALLTDKYPDMKLILAHLGSIEHVEAIALPKLGNVYTDTSGSASVQNNVLEYAVEKVGAEKILFGTDSYSCAFQLGRVVFADITEEEKYLILSGNAKRIFGLET